MVGHCNDSVVHVWSLINALIVTVSNVTYMPENFNESLEDKPVFRDLQDFQLKLMVLEVMHFHL